MTENPHIRYNTLDTKSGRGHLQGISKPGGLKNTERNHGSFVFSLWAKTCFPSHTLTCSLTHAHAWTQIHYKASAIKNSSELYVTVSFYFDNRCLPLPSFMVSGIPAKNKGWLLKKKDQGGTDERSWLGEGTGGRWGVCVKGGRVGQQAWHPKVRSNTLWQEALWGMAVSVRNLPHLLGPVNLAAIINLSLVKYKYCKSQHDPVPLGGLHLSATDLG